MNLPIELKLIHENYKNGTWKLPAYQTNGAAAFDLLAAIDRTVVLGPGNIAYIRSGLAVSIQNPDYMLLLLPRSGAGCRGLALNNTMGVIDSDYQGEIILCVRNTKEFEDLCIDPGERIVQGILMEKMNADFTIVDEFSTITDRGAGGFGSTGA